MSFTSPPALSWVHDFQLPHWFQTSPRCPHLFRSSIVHARERIDVPILERYNLVCLLWLPFTSGLRFSYVNLISAAELEYIAGTYVQTDEVCKIVSPQVPTADVVFSSIQLLSFALCDDYEIERASRIVEREFHFDHSRNRHEMIATTPPLLIAPVVNSFVILPQILTLSTSL